MMVKSGIGKIFLEIPPCAHYVIFITEFVLLIKIPPFYEVNLFNRKRQVHGGISKIFFLDHFSTSFLGQKLPEMLKFHPYFILIGQKIVGFVIYYV